MHGRMSTRGRQRFGHQSQLWCDDVGDVLAEAVLAREAFACVAAVAFVAGHVGQRVIFAAALAGAPLRLCACVIVVNE